MIQNTDERSLYIGRAISVCIARGIPFYAYRLPYSDKILFGAQSESTVTGIGDVEVALREKGFVLSPFDPGGKHRAYLLKPDVDQDTPDLISRLSVMENSGCLAEFQGADISKEAYYTQVNRWVNLMKCGNLRKAVLSRTRTIFCEGEEIAEPVFLGLLDRYRQALVYIANIPGVTLWAGATPETLVRQNRNYTEIMSLAGTKKVDDVTAWGDKDREEQQIVTDYIANIFMKVAGEKPLMEGPFTKQAGVVSHLCTLLRSGKPCTAPIAASLVKQLHPTPAVGGFPLEKAIRLIRETEIHDRGYYAGYLGPVYGNNTFDLFVNLRSMELFRNAVRLYIGSGITALSRPENEWIETEMKSRTLLDVAGIS